MRFWVILVLVGILSFGCVSGTDTDSGDSQGSGFNCPKIERCESMELEANKVLCYFNEATHTPRNPECCYHVPVEPVFRAPNNQALYRAICFYNSLNRESVPKAVKDYCSEVKMPSDGYDIHDNFYNSETNVNWCYSLYGRYKSKSYCDKLTTAESRDQCRQ